MQVPVLNNFVFRSTVAIMFSCFWKSLQWQYTFLKMCFFFIQSKNIPITFDGAKLYTVIISTTSVIQYSIFNPNAPRTPPVFYPCTGILTIINWLITFIFLYIANGKFMLANKSFEYCLVKIRQYSSRN